MDISTEVIEYISDEYENMMIKKNRLVSCHEEHKVVIPSRLFPLEGEGGIRVFAPVNTKRCMDEKIRKIYDAMDYEPGACYMNTMHLFMALEAAGYKELSMFAGWYYISPDTLPVHHCVLVYKDVYVFDLSTDDAHEETIRILEKPGSFDLKRKQMMNRLLYREANLLNSKRTCFGYMQDHALFIGRQCSADEGERIKRQLMEQYPDHIAF